MKLSRRGLFGLAAALGFAGEAKAESKNLALKSSGRGFGGSSGAFLEAKRREIDALYEEASRTLSIHMWGEQ